MIERNVGFSATVSLLALMSGALTWLVSPRWHEPPPHQRYVRTIIRVADYGNLLSRCDVEPGAVPERVGLIEHVVIEGRQKGVAVLGMELPENCV